MGAWFTSIFGTEREQSDFYECLHCRQRYDDWQDGCPQCGQLVVRIVESPNPGH